MGSKGGRKMVQVGVFATRNAIEGYACLGAVLALCLGVAGGLLCGQRSINRSVLAGMTGLIVGAAGTAAVCYFVIPIYYANVKTADVTLSMLIHLGIWTVIGAASGLAFGIGSGSRTVLARAFVGAATGAGIATLIYDISGAFLPLAGTDRPISQIATTRLAASLLLSACVAGGMMITAFQKPRVTAPKPL